MPFCSILPFRAFEAAFLLTIVNKTAKIDQVRMLPLEVFE